MAWLCVDEDGDETMIFDNKPKRDASPTCGGYWSRNEENDCCNVDLPKGTIKKLIGKELTWESEPYELKDNIKSEKKKKFNWRIMLLSIIWSLVLICLSNIAIDLSGTGKLIAVILVALVMSFVFYFGYRDVDITSDYTEDENDFFKK